MDKQPIHIFKKLPSGSKLVRFNDISDIYWYDNIENNPHGLGMSREERINSYIAKRSVMSPEKFEIIRQARKELSIDREFLQLVYKGESEKRKFDKNKFSGNFSPVDYASNSEKVFKKMVPGAKKKTLNLAFQVGTFCGGNYSKAFLGILKTVLMCQALGIALNIDMFDSDTAAINFRSSYVLVNVAKSNEKLNFRKILACSHEEFFNISLFNGYAASGYKGRIGSFLEQDQIVEDLGPYYDIIGGNMINEINDPMVSKIIKIGLGGVSR